MQSSLHSSRELPNQISLNCSSILVVCCHTWNGQISWVKKSSFYLRSSTCPLTGFFWLLSHVIYHKLTKVSYECLLSQSWVMGSRTSFSVSQQLRPELSAKWMLSIFSDSPHQKNWGKCLLSTAANFWIIKLTKTSIFPVPNSVFLDMI